MSNFVSHRTDEMKALHRETTDPKNIDKTQGLFRYVNHEQKIATIGFVSIEKLKKYEPDIRFDTKTIEIMRQRYQEIYGQ